MPAISLHELKLNYGSIKNAASSARKAADHCGEYREELRRKVTTKFGGIEGGQSSYLSQANSYADNKIKQLAEKEEKYRGYAQKLNEFVAEAKETDRRAADKIRKSYDLYVKEHNIQISWCEEAFVSLVVWAGNATEFGKFLKMGFDVTTLGLSNMKQNIQYWYHCEGGREIVNIVVAVTVCAVAVAVTIVAPYAFPALAAAGGTFATVAAGAACIGTSITVMNTLADVSMETAAYQSISRGDIVEGRMLGNVDTMPDLLRMMRFGSGGMNRMSMAWAEGYEFVDFACSVIGVADMARNGVNFFRGVKKGFGSLGSGVSGSAGNGLRTIKVDDAAATVDLTKIKNYIQSGGISRNCSWKDLKEGWKVLKGTVNTAVVNPDVMKKLDDFAAANKWYKTMKDVTDKLDKIVNISNFAGAFAEHGWQGSEAWKLLTSDIDFVDKINESLEKIGAI